MRVSCHQWQHYQQEMTNEKDNRRLSSSTTPNLNIYAAPTGITNGAVIWEAKGGSAKKAGGTSRDSSEFMLKSNTVYVLAVENIAAQVSWFDYKFDWYEHVDKE